MDHAIFRFCETNYKGDEVNEKYLELYNVVKFIMDWCGIDDNAMYANLAVFDIIHAYLNNKIMSLDKYCEYLVEHMFEITP